MLEFKKRFYQKEVEQSIKSREDLQSYKPFLHSDSNTYKVTQALLETKSRLIGMDGSLPYPYNKGCWDDINGIPIPMTIKQVCDLADAVYDRGAWNYEVQRNHVAAMKASDDPTKYDYSTGWK